MSHGQPDQRDYPGEIEPAQLRETEQLLSSFAPRAPRLKREQLLDLVRPSAMEVALPAMGRTPWYWPAATAVMTATSLALMVIISWQAAAEPEVKYRDRIVYRDRLVPAPATMASAKASATPVATAPSHTSVSLAVGKNQYLQERELALTRGIDALPAPNFSGDGDNVRPASSWELMREYTPLKLRRQMEPATTSAWSLLLGG